MPGPFIDPRWQKREDAPKETYYQAFFGSTETEATAFGTDKDIPVEEIKRGNGMPLLLVEAASPVPWAKPGDIDIAKPLPKLGGPEHQDFLGVFLDFNDTSVPVKVALFPASTSEKDLRMLINYRKKPDKTVDYKIVGTVP
jgi:hypothetical protein